MLLLARSLQAAPDLHLDLSRAENHFAGWMATIVMRHCQEAARKLRNHQRKVESLGDGVIASQRPSDLDACIDLNMAVEQLSDPLRAVLALHAKGWSIHESAARLGMSYWKTRRLLLEGLDQLRRLLA